MKFKTPYFKKQFIICWAGQLHRMEKHNQLLKSSIDSYRSVEGLSDEVMFNNLKKALFNSKSTSDFQFSELYNKPFSLVFGQDIPEKDLIAKMIDNATEIQAGDKPLSFLYIFDGMLMENIESTPV